MKSLVGGTRPPYLQWLRFSATYVAVVAAGHLIWEILQLPLYTIWREAGPGEIAFAVAHCTGGDLLIATTALAAAILGVGRGRSPELPGAYARVAATAVLLGLGYTVFSEWYNTRVERSWEYASLMPVVPPFDVGLSPLLQWILVPGIAFFWLRSRRASLDLQSSSASSNETR
jgi:hypothetical protein